ncbi:alpha/beta fold hydrolase [Thalassovita aquimarina]|uniref:Alpha/beta hydrolase n=1 Tax=Thalassovita aquimarina TaxID=2785917 RepID=A0ABS5HTG9_9RHOB|nr:alpha/beta hydrolase [Thalassovita aquimarina]MBR9652284.1 alpha/beta hydrolase [Thalassovita aquimarina]
MNTPRSVFLPLMGHDIHVMEWGDPSSPPLIMWHGLARNGRDFDELALALSGDYFVICPDTLGRGLSSWAEKPYEQYVTSYYARIAEAMLDHYGIEKTAWIGTSMGALIGMHVASGAYADRITAFIINDIAPEIPDDALARIITYARALPEFFSMAEAETWLRSVYAPFGPAPDGFWQRMAETSVRRRGDGKLTLHYDPRIIDAFEAIPDQIRNWPFYERITAPTHILQGTQSDLLTDELLAKMMATGPHPEASLFPACGHAPNLANPEDAELIAGLLKKLTS